MEDFRQFLKILIRKYLTGSIFLTSPQVISSVVSLVTLPIILANLPLEDYGKFQFVVALQALVVLTGRNITMGSKRGIANNLDGTFLFAFFARLKYLVMLGLIGIIFSFVLYEAGVTTLSILLIIMSTYLIVGHLFQIGYQQFFIAKRQFKNLAIWSIITSILASSISALTAYLTHNILLFAVTQLGVITLISCLAWTWAVKKNKLISAYRKKEIDWECVSYGLKLIPADSIEMIAYKISHFIIASFFGFANLAIFSVAYKMRDKFAGILKQSRSLIYADFAREEQSKLVIILNSNLKYGIFFSLVLTFVCAIGGYFYIRIFLPESYIPAIKYFFILSLGLPAAVLQIIIQVILETNFRHKELASLFIISNVIRIVLIVVLGFVFGIIGVCTGIVLGGWTGFGLCYLLTLKKELVSKYVHINALLEKSSLK